MFLLKFRFILRQLYTNLALQKHMSITGLMRCLSLTGIDAIWQLSLGCLLMRTRASFIRYTGYLNFINGPIKVIRLQRSGIDTIKYHTYKSRFIANSSACTTTELSFLLTCLTAIKNHVIINCTTVYEGNGKKLIWSIKNSGEILNKLKSRGFLASVFSTYDFSTLYTTLRHNLIKEKLTELIEQNLTERVHFIWPVVIKMPVLLLNSLNDINYGHVRKCVMHSIIFWTIIYL